MNNKYYLADEYSIVGNTFAEFKTAITEMEKNLHFYKTNSEDITILSLKEIKENVLIFYGFNPSKKIISEFPQLPLEAFEYEYYIESPEEKELLLKELQINKLCLYDNLRGLFFFTSDHIKNDMVLIGMGGSAMTEPSVERDMLLARLFRTNRKFTLVVKEDDFENKKIFGVRSGRYKPLSQHVLLDIVNELNKDKSMGETECRNWEINHFLTNLDVEFPDKANEVLSLEVESGKANSKKLSDFLTTPPVPGLRLITSDTGDSSVQVMGTWRIGNSRIITDIVATRHSKKAEIETIIEDCRKTIFSGFRMLPEKLCELTMLNITNPRWDLSSEEGESENRNAICAVIDSVFNQLKIEKAIGKKRCKVLYDLFTETLDYTLPFTGYDVAMMILDIPARIQNLDKATLERLEKCIGNIINCDFSVKQMFFV